MKLSEDDIHEKFRDAVHEIVDFCLAWAFLTIAILALGSFVAWSFPSWAAIRLVTAFSLLAVFYVGKEKKK